jgi:threonine dehydrogenase-like Zn-dependent dehydrogenase
MSLLLDGTVTAAEMVTSVRPLTEAAQAFAEADSGRHIKVLLTNE